MNAAIRWVIITLLVVHGLIHVMGFLKEWHLAEIPALTDRTIVPLSDTMSRVLGVVWLVACVVLLTAGVALAVRAEQRWGLALFGIALSQMLTILWWNDAQFGTVANVLLLAAVLLPCDVWACDPLMTGRTPCERTRRPMTETPSLAKLWNAAWPSQRTFRPGELAGYPDVARRYLEHAIAPGTLRASAVRLRMHGEIKLRRWAPFTAEQVIHWGHGMIWSATVRMNGMPIRGFDRLVNGEGAMRWKLFGIVPVITASGPDITRSAAGRVMAESVWLPSVLCGDDVSWAVQDSFHPRARLTVQGEPGDLVLAIDDQGRLKTLTLPRWGNPEGAAFHYVDFGGVAEEEGRFGGYTIPTRLRVGWYIGTDRFEPDGEFFRVTIDDAAYR